MPEDPDDMCVGLGAPAVTQALATLTYTFPSPIPTYAIYPSPNGFDCGNLGFYMTPEPAGDVLTGNPGVPGAVQETVQLPGTLSL